MQSILRKSSWPRGLIVVIILFLTLVSGVILASHVQAASLQPTNGERLVTIHDRGQERSILTRAATLREAFKGAHIPIDPNDLVEPGLDDQLVAKNYEVNIYRARPVTIIDGAIHKRVMSPYRTAKQIVQQANMTLHDEDLTSMSLTTDMLSDGTGVQLSIDRATPFTLVLYGEKAQAYTQAKTVGEMLAEKHITLGPKDTVSVAKDKEISAGMKISIWRDGKQTVTRKEKIAFPVQQIQDADKPVGYHKITTPGVNGEKMVTYEVTTKNGKEVKRKKIQSVVITEAKKQVEVVGTKPAFSGSFADALAKLRSCEGGYTTNTGNGYYGAYQFDLGTWGNYKGYPNAAAAPPSVQDEKAWETYQRRGWGPWPVCGAGLPDTYR